MDVTVALTVQVGDTTVTVTHRLCGVDAEGARTDAARLVDQAAASACRDLLRGPEHAGT